MEGRNLLSVESKFFPLKGYCTVFQHALKSLEITGIVYLKECRKLQGKIPKV